MHVNKNIKILWEYLGPYKTKVYFIAFVATIVSAIGSTIPYIYGRLVDVAIDQSSKVELILGILGFWLILKLISDWLGRYVNETGTNVAMLGENSLLLGLTSHILKLPMSFHKDKKMGEILQRVSRASDRFADLIDRIGFHLAPNLLKSIIALAILAYVEWHLSLVILVILISYVMATLLKTKPIVATQKKLNKAYEKAYGQIYNSTLNIQTVKSNTAENLEEKRNARNYTGVAERLKAFMRSWVKMGVWQQSILGIGFVVVFGAATFLLRLGFISTGELVMFVGYVSLIYQPVTHLSNNYRFLKRSMTIIDRALSLLKIETEEYEKEKGIDLKKIKRDIVFNNVSFSYKKGKPILRNVSFQAKPGEVIALVGESGVGKTTLTDLISRYIEPMKGKITIDGHNIKDIKIESLRRVIALVPQEASLFNATIKENLLYGRPKATDKELIEISKAANAHQFINKFPKKYKQFVGERGVKLSTGQKQRVAIARALITNPQVLILDEATSSLDSASEKLVQQALKRLIKGRTTFIIAHRLSTIAHADKILVLEKGKIVERGTHAQLIRKKKGIYRKFYAMQSAKIDPVVSF